jgi:hypothetical protein
VFSEKESFYLILCLFYNSEWNWSSASPIEQYVIASTGAVVVNRRRIGKITDNPQEPIGRGGFGQVFKETWHGRQVAAKEIRSSWRCSTVVEARSFAKMIQREVEALSAVFSCCLQLQRNIIGLLGPCMDNESSDGETSIWVSLIFEFANGGTLFDCLFGGQANKSKFKFIRRESNDSDRSPSHRKALHLLHSTQQKPGGSVSYGPPWREIGPICRDVKSFGNEEFGKQSIHSVSVKRDNREGIFWLSVGG